MPRVNPSLRWPVAPDGAYKRVIDDLEQQLERFVQDVALRVNTEVLLLSGGVMTGTLSFQAGYGWLLLPVIAGDMGGSKPGNIWYNSTLGAFRVNVAGTVKTIQVA